MSKFFSYRRKGVSVKGLGQIWWCFNENNSCNLVLCVQIAAARKFWSVLFWSVKYTSTRNKKIQKCKHFFSEAANICLSSRPVKFGKLIRVRFMIMKCLNLSPTMVGRRRKFLIYNPGNKLMAKCQKLRESSIF